jgi:flavorubredoxin
VAGYFGSFAWSGGAKAEFDKFAEQMSWDVLGTVEFVGSAKKENIEAIVNLARSIAQKVKS